MSGLRLALATLLFAGVAPHAHAQCRSWFVARTANTIELRARTVAPGAADTVPLDGTPIVTVVLAVSEGQAGDIVQRARGGQVVSRCQRDTLVVSLLRDGAARELMRQPLATLQARRVVVNVTGGDGVTARWRLDGWEKAARDNAPVVDMFRGAVPMGAGDHAITTVVDAFVQAPSLVAQIPLDTRSGYPIATLSFGATAAAAPRRAVVDLAAATTIVRRAALPSGVTPRPVSMRQQSAEGVRVLPLAGEGAGGSVDGFSAATLPTLTIGATTLRNVEVLVLEALPNIGGAPLDAIVGLDLLRTAGRLSFTRQDSVRTLLTLGPSPAPRAPDATATMRAVGALWGIDATVRAPSAAAPVTPLFLVLDSGAPFTVLGSAAARAAALALTPSPGPAPRGLDGAPLAMSDAIIGTLQVGAAGRSAAVPITQVRVADLPVLAKIRSAGVGLLGFDALRVVSRVELDFGAEQLRLWR